MDCRTHERGVGMLNTPYVKKDTIKNFFPVPYLLIRKHGESQ